jgi:ParB family chromosome partitioning protein
MNPPNKKDALGQGIRSLLQNIDTDLKSTTASLDSAVTDRSMANIARVPLDKIETNPDQPRKDFDDTALSELASSIKLHNIIQPLTVSPMPGGKYRLVAGERRFRAAKIAGLKDVPVYIRHTTGDEMLELALLENLQRENLNAIEIGLGYKRLIDEMDYTQEQVAERMGKERATVANYIRLLKLPPDIQVAVRNGVISMGHARALINVDATEKQLYIFSEIRKHGLSVRQTEDLVRKIYTNDVPKKPLAKSNQSAEFKKIEDSIASQYSTKVRLNHNRKGHGSITFEYYSLEELNGLLDKLKVKIS